MVKLRAAIAALVGVGMVVAGTAIVVAARSHGASGPSAADAIALSRHPVTEDVRWRAYDEAPSAAVVHPVRVLEVAGDVTNPGALAGKTAGTTTLTYARGGTAPSLVLDYGKDVGGVAQFDVITTSAATFSAEYSETLVNMGNDGVETIGLFASGSPTRTDVFTVRAPGLATASLLQSGERYEKVTLKTPGSLTLRSAGIRFTALRETPSLMQGHFLSSDDLLNRIWYAGAYTLNLNQMTPGTTVEPGAIDRLHLILDGAKRDRAVWSGDQLISGLTDLYLSDPSYVRDSLALLLEHPADGGAVLTIAKGNEAQPGPLPGACSPNPQLNNFCDNYSATYSMATIIALYDYYLYTGDLGFVRRHWQSVVRQMEWDARQVDRNGLFSVSPIDAYDWNVENVPGELAYANAIYVLALQSAARLSSAIADTWDAATWLKSAGAITDAMNTRLWNQTTGIYDASTSERGAVVQDANVTAVLAGIPSRSRARAIVTVLRHSLRSRYGLLNVSTPVPAHYIQDVSPFIGGLNVFADFQAGDDAAALALIRQEWGFMVSHDPGGTEWERIVLGGIPPGGASAYSSAHAWATGPTPALSEYVLGVVPFTPGYTTWRVVPESGDLRWAQGVVPTPRGAIRVRWRRNGSQSFVLTIHAPAGTSGTVAVPLLGRMHPIARDGRLVWNGRRAVGGAHANQVGSYVQFSGVRGGHTFAW